MKELQLLHPRPLNIMRLPNRKPLWSPNRNRPPIDQSGLMIWQSGASIDQSLVLVNRVEQFTSLADNPFYPLTSAFVSQAWWSSFSKSHGNRILGTGHESFCIVYISQIHQTNRCSAYNLCHSWRERLLFRWRVCGISTSFANDYSDINPRERP